MQSKEDICMAEEGCHEAEVLLTCFYLTCLLIMQCWNTYSSCKLIVERFTETNFIVLAENETGTLGETR